MLMRHGIRRVRPLEGGLDAWIAAGLPTVEVTQADPAPVPE
jgi:3-mercaptopyruvate sulfurtransferase SseA